jgi:hypothetical protein
MLELSNPLICTLVPDAAKFSLGNAAQNAMACRGFSQSNRGT